MALRRVCLRLLLALTLVLGRIKLVKLPKLVVLTRIYQVLTVDLTELVVVTVDFYFIGNQGFIAIVMALYDESVNETKVDAAGRWVCHLRKDEVIVAVCEDERDLDARLESDLIIVPIDSQTLHSVHLGDFEASVVIV